MSGTPAATGNHNVADMVALLAKSAREVLGDGAVIVPATGPARPDLMVAHRDIGLVCIDVDLAGHDPSDRATRVRLNRKLIELQDAVDRVADLAVTGVVVFAVLETILPERPGVAGNADAESGAWLQSVARMPSPLPEDKWTGLLDVIAPSLTFASRRTGATDHGAGARREQRFALDAEQALAAQAAAGEALVVSGSAGTGKTLVLAARARWFAQEHPDWAIRLICYNRALVPYLRSLVAGLPQVHVDTFGQFAAAAGHRVSLDDESRAARDVAAASRTGIARHTDAILIDEAQDFMAPWIQFCLRALRPGRGGITLAGDGGQALYRDLDIALALGGLKVSQLTLTRPYRSTRQILEAVAALDPRYAVAGAELAPDGEPVELIWAGSWDEQARCTAWEIRRMLDSGQRMPADIAILVTQIPATMRRLSAALDAAGIPFLQVNRTNASTFDAAADAVKVITVHSAKGHEFPVVMLFGLEALPDSLSEDMEHQRRARVGYVGMTRAQDQLLVTYTRHNPLLKRLDSTDGAVRKWTWPDDYEV